MLKLQLPRMQRRNQRSTHRVNCCVLHKGCPQTMVPPTANQPFTLPWPSYAAGYPSFVWTPMWLSYSSYLCLKTMHGKIEAVLAWHWWMDCAQIATESTAWFIGCYNLFKFLGCKITICSSEPMWLNSQTPSRSPPMNPW